ncbi:hypothetical protein [Plasmodium yoelii yoelii]|uniref:Uncharacterized protein n=1 Tax=Plasmodium yoelii yoelii TaxID=73239 RepID=Q7RJ77_PLAYO|nr:hypothetical protein [Plasmodium yoelii yoelii]
METVYGKVILLRTHPLLMLLSKNEIPYISSFFTSYMSYHHMEQSYRANVKQIYTKAIMKYY